MVREQVLRNTTFTIIKDPVTRRYFRVPAAAWRIARRFDSKTPVETVALELSSGGDPVTPDDVLDVATRFERLALLDTGLSPAQVRRAQAAASGERRSVFYLKRPLFDPDRVLARMLALVRPLFTWPAMLALAVLVLFAVILHATYPGEAAGAVASALHGSGIAWLYAVTAVTLTVHEFAHGLTCKRFGGEVHEMGVMLLYFMPCAYTDISDAYLVPRKRDRILITLAGSVADLALWALATAVLYFASPGGTGEQVLGALMLTTGFRTVAFNLNPLIRLDGYFVLVDLLEMPNLRVRSRAVLARRVARWAGRPPGPAIENARDGRVLEIYGWLSLAYVVVLLLVTAVLTGRWLAGFLESG